MMMIITMKNILLLVCTISLASGFVVTNPSGSATRRLDRTRTYIAAAPMKDDIRKTTTIPSGPKRHQITTINSVEEYERFLPAEDRLTLIR
jgi:Na+-transporting NADH:ubiquinone oxidoreductase subunit NqrC